VPTRLVHLALDAADPGRLARFWAAALHWEVAAEEAGVANVWPRGYRYPDPVALPLVFLVRADVGQGSVSWTVLADPEGSEFCLPSPL
jgi:Glyoxalase-like domain